ncbi:hypothetical protein M769_0110465 [Bacillus haynesii]|nr:hypothetical protein M769_0110465 [Bacillus haynesii]
MVRKGNLTWFFFTEKQKEDIIKRFVRQKNYFIIRTCIISLNHFPSFQWGLKRVIILARCHPQKT